MNTAKRVDFSLVLPLYNEGLILKSNLSRIYSTLKYGSFTFEMILIDDGSTDETVDIAELFSQNHNEVVFFQQSTNQGRGATVMTGFRRANGDVIGYIDVDCEVSPVYLLEFCPYLLTHQCDVVTGARIYKFSLGRTLRTLSSVLYRTTVSAVLHTKFKDTETGYKIFKRESFNIIAPYLEHTGWFWDTEVMAVSKIAGLSIEEHNVLFVSNSRKRSTVHLFKDALYYLQSLYSFRKRLPLLKKELQK